MSETSEQQVTTRETGRCEKAAHEVTHSSWSQQFHQSVLQMSLAGWALALNERDKLRAEIERLRGELAARPADGNRQATLDSSPAAPRPAAPPPGWLTTGERGHLWFTLDLLRRSGYSPAAKAVGAILASSGSPPVVEVPALESLGDAACHQARAYRAAMDKAGVKWKEVGRE